MSTQDQQGMKADRPEMCAAGQVADAYLVGAATKKERRSRARRLLAFGAKTYFGLTTSDIALAFNIDRSFITRELADARSEIQACAARLGLGELVPAESAAPAAAETKAAQSSDAA